MENKDFNFENAIDDYVNKFEQEQIEIAELEKYLGEELFVYDVDSIETEQDLEYVLKKLDLTVDEFVDCLPERE